MKISRYKLGVAIAVAILIVSLVLLLIGATTDWNFGFVHFTVVLFGAWAVYFFFANLAAKHLYGLGFVSVGCAMIALFVAIALPKGLPWYVALIVSALYAAVVFGVMLLFKRGWDAGDNNTTEYKKYERKDGR